MQGNKADDNTIRVIQLSVLSRLAIPLLIFHNENNTEEIVSGVNCPHASWVVSLELTNGGDAETKDFSQFSVFLRSELTARIPNLTNRSEQPYQQQHHDLSLGFAFSTQNKRTTNSLTGFPDVAVVLIAAVTDW